MNKDAAEIRLNQYENIEPLDDGYSIIQSALGYRFGADAVDLYKFSRAFAGARTRVLDLCSGSGVVGIMLAAKTGCVVDGVEIDEELWDMSVRSCVLNGLDKVRFYRADLREKTPEIPKGAYDLVVCNPPFFKANSKPSEIAPNANSELTVCFDDVAKKAADSLKAFGVFCIVHTSSRLDEILCTCREHSLMPKELEVNANGKTFLLRAVKEGKAGMTVRVCTARR